MITAPENNEWTHESRAEALNEISTSIKEYYKNRKDSDQRKKDSERLIHVIKYINDSTLVNHHPNGATCHHLMEPL